LNKTLFLKSFCLKAGRLRPAPTPKGAKKTTTVYPLRKISYGFFSISALLKPDNPKVAYARTGEGVSIKPRFCNRTLLQSPTTSNTTISLIYPPST
jgi:hypothetical protein